MRAIIQTDGEIETVDDVADIAEISPGRLQVVYADESSEFLSGSLFGGWGEWRVWLDTERGDELQQHVGEDPLTMPRDFIRFRSSHSTQDRAATIKRLKLPNL